MQRTHGLRFVSLSLAVVLVGTSCQPLEEGEENVGVAQQPLYTVGTCSSDTAFTATKDAIRWAAPVSALPTLERAFRWIKQAQYDQGKSCNDFPNVCCNGGCGSPPTAYRTDCSGFVSHAWGLNSAPTTAYLPGYGTDLGNLDNLVPGDAINRNNCGDGCNHAEIFGGWMNASKTSFCTLELYTTSSPAEIRSALRSDHSAYTPLRLNGWVPWGFRTTLENDSESNLWRKCADATGSNPAQQDCEGNDNQSWLIVGNASFSANEAFLQLKGTSQCLVPASMAANAYVNLVTCDTSTLKHRWKFDNLRIKAGNLGCLSIDPASSPWHVKLDSSCGALAERNWDYDEYAQTLKITVSGTTKCMDVADGNAGTWVRAMTCDGSTGQKWVRSQGGFTTARSSGRCLDATNTQIKLADCDGTEPQRLALRGTIANAKDTSLCLGHENGVANGNRLMLEACDSGDTTQLWQSWSKQ